MIADVSSHGYRAALIMALAMSATAIHAQTSNDPGEVLNALLGHSPRSSSRRRCSYPRLRRDRSGKRDTALREHGHPHAIYHYDEGTMKRLAALDPHSVWSMSHRRAYGPLDAQPRLLVLLTDGCERRPRP